MLINPLLTIFTTNASNKINKVKKNIIAKKLIIPSNIKKKGAIDRYKEKNKASGIPQKLFFSMKENIIIQSGKIKNIVISRMPTPSPTIFFLNELILIYEFMVKLFPITIIIILNI